MYLRTILATPLLLAFSLTAQDKPDATPEQGRSSAERIQELKQERARLKQEVRYTRERVENAKSLLMNRLNGVQQNFRTIDAGVSVSRRAAAAPPKRKFARLMNAKELERSQEGTMVIVQEREIGSLHFNRVMDYMRSISPKADESVLAQRVLFDMIRIEAIAAKFIESDGEGQLGAALNALDDGMAMDEVIKKFGKVRSSDESGLLEVRHNSVHGPYFEQVVFGTEVGKRSRPFRNPFGYVIIELVEIKKGATPQQDIAVCKALQIQYTEDVQALSQAQMAVNTGQIEVLARDQQTLDMLPQMFRQPQQTPADRMKNQIGKMQDMLKEMDAKGEGKSERATQLRQRLEQMQKQLEQQRKAPTPADRTRAVEDSAKKLEAAKLRGAKTDATKKDKR